MNQDVLPLGDSIKVSFERLALDPNNPRLGRAQPGYDDPKQIFEDEIQKDLELRMNQMYQQLPELENAILGQGWVPIDAILVWEHPKKKGYYVVVEGNSRTTVLREIRRKLANAQKNLEQKKKKNADKDEIKVVEEQIAQLKSVVDRTNTIAVTPVSAANNEELQETLPRLLGVRHISHAQQWKPYPKNLYVLNLYRKLFADTYGKGDDLRLEEGLIKQVANAISQSTKTTRQNIQAASAFTHFKAKFEDRLPDGETFADEDQYFFELLLQNKYPREQFRWKDELRLSDEMEEVLFQWSFSKPRPENKENPNIFYKAESIRTWAQMKKFDDKAHTGFAAQFDVDNPDAAIPIMQIEAEYLSARVRQSPVDVMGRLINAFKELPTDALRSQGTHLRPMLLEVLKISQDFLNMMGAVKA